jgi:hypothetical protein
MDILKSQNILCKHVEANFKYPCYQNLSKKKWSICCRTSNLAACYFLCKNRSDKITYKNIWINPLPPHYLITIGRLKYLIVNNLFLVSELSVLIRNLRASDSVHRRWLAVMIPSQSWWYTRIKKLLTRSLTDGWRWPYRVKVGDIPELTLRLAPGSNRR